MNIVKFSSLLIILLLFIINVSIFDSHSLPICDKGKDTYGNWLNTSQYSNKFDKYYSFHGPGQALNFSQIWLPNNCSYVRFTNESIYKSIQYYINKSNDISNNMIRRDTIRLVFIGDSVTRGLYCSITRILNGNSEIYGPLNSKACGGKDYGKHVNTHPSYPWHDLIFYNGKLSMHFIFVTSFCQPKDHIDWKMEWSLTNDKPFALVLNTGAWDFQPQWNIYPVKTPYIEICNTNELIATSKSRIQPFINNSLREMDWLNKEHNKGDCQLIYRNIHYNKRFGTLCSDEEFEEMIKDTSWTIFDTRRISYKVWENQMSDGLHIDRKDTYTYEDHIREREESIRNDKIFPGQLEMQLTQSFLNGIFHSSLHIHY